MRSGDRRDRLLAAPRTILNLGLGNVFRKACYRLGIRARLHPVTRLKSRPVATSVFRAEVGARVLACHPGWHADWWAYGLQIADSGTGVPDWHGPLGRATGSAVMDPWWALPAMPANDDIKDVWEFSRMDWVLCMAQRVACGDAAESGRLRQWLNDWIVRNPPYRGRNWACGQEASIRVIHLLLAARIMGELDRTEPALLDLTEVHLHRIAATIGYAIAQRNNHASSEAAALFVGGSWLEHQGRSVGRRWRERGWRLLRNAVIGCTCPDGTLSQYSPNYQRLFLDAVAIADLVRSEFSLPPFDDDVAARLRACTQWLDSMVDPRTGDTSNIGGNDGAMLLPIGPAGYRNFRPSLHLASTRFGQPIRQPFDEDTGTLLAWLGLKPLGQTVKPKSRLCSSGGFVVTHGVRHWGVLRLPQFQFRPAHADALHFDLWIDGRNIFRDSGSGRYSGDRRWTDWFPSTAAHSTIEFDGRSQMPRLGRFLFGSWLSPAASPEFRVTGTDGTTTAGYVDRWGAKHRRTVQWTDGKVAVADEIGGTFQRATVRWHLSNEDWRVCSDRLESKGVAIQMHIDHRPVLPTLSRSPTSLHYGEIIETPMIFLEVMSPCIIRTTVEWAS